MYKRMRTVGLAMGVGLCIAALIASSCATTVPAAREKKVAIGGQLIFSGPLGSAGYRASPAFIDCCEWINEKGGIDGINIKVLWEDTQGFIPKSLTSYKRFREAGAPIIIQMSSGPTEALTPWAARDKVPIVWGYMDPPQE